MTTVELKSYIDRILGNNVRCLLPSYWWKRAFGMTLDKMDADKEELIKKIQSAGSKVTVDSALSTTSTNVVQNKVVTEAINERPTALQMLEFVGNTYEDVNRSVYIGNTEDYYIVNWKETNKTNLTRNVSENEIIHFRIKYILDEYNFITLNPVSIERFPSTTADYATYYECVVCINDAYERWRIYVDGSVEFVGLENIGEASGALQFGQERMVYFENPNTSAKLTDEQKAYNAETYKMVSIDDKPVYLSYFGHWGYQKELTFGDPNGHMIVGFLMGSKDSLQEASVRINADGSAYLIGLVNIADATLDAESERPIQNKAVYAALEEIRGSASGGVQLLEVRYNWDGSELSDEDKEVNAATYAKLIENTNSIPYVIHNDIMGLNAKYRGTIMGLPTEDYPACVIVFDIPLMNELVGILSYEKYFIELSSDGNIGGYMMPEGPIGMLGLQVGMTFEQIMEQITALGITPDIFTAFQDKVIISEPDKMYGNLTYASIGGTRIDFIAEHPLSGLKRYYVCISTEEGGDGVLKAFTIKNSTLYINPSENQVDINKDIFADTALTDYLDLSTFKIRKVNTYYTPISYYRNTILQNNQFIMDYVQVTIYCDGAFETWKINADGTTQQIAS